MSTLIVPVVEIDDIRPHPNADRLALATIGGWQVVVGKDSHQPGDLVVYVPPDAVVPLEYSDRWGVTNYLSNGRVKCARLRGEPSFGFTVPISDLPADRREMGQNVAEVFGITKYEPPVWYRGEDVERDHPLFVKYTEIENMRHFPHLIEDGEPVVMTEKIHGTNSRVGLIEGELMAGSHNTRKKRPEDLQGSLYWYPLTLPSVVSLLEDLREYYQQAILFGEIYGKVQSLCYGLQNAIAYRAFDLLVDGKYLDYPAFDKLCRAYNIPTVPLLYRGPFSLETARSMSEGPTTIGGDHLREGTVVKPEVDRRDLTIGRVILKYVSDQYLLSGKDEPVAEEVAA